MAVDHDDLVQALGELRCAKTVGQILLSFSVGLPR
jgi:hypothetical protein